VAQPKEARRSSVKLLVGIGLGLVALVAGTVVLTMWLVRLVTG
jgi:hypothetical protein